jgi:hypothetical protein
MLSPASSASHCGRMLGLQHRSQQVMRRRALCASSRGAEASASVAAAHPSPPCSGLLCSDVHRPAAHPSPSCCSVLCSDAPHPQLLHPLVQLELLRNPSAAVPFTERGCRFLPTRTERDVCQPGQRGLVPFAQQGQKGLSPLELAASASSPEPTL